MKKLVFSLSIFGLLMGSCTNLEEGIYDQQVSDNFYSTPAGAGAALANIYAEIRGDWGGKGIAGGDRGWFDLNEITSDEMVIPIRADGAWADNGVWLQIYQHKWDASHEFFNGTWNWLYRSIFRANLAVELLENAKADPSRIAEAKVLRAYFYYMLMDGWGNVPFYTKNDVTVDKIPQASRKEVYDFVLKELLENVDKLTATKGGEFYGRFNKWAGYAFLARLYLNSEVYVGTPKWTEALNAANKVINEGGFKLVGDYLSLFGDRCPDDEVIMAMFVDANLAPRNIIGIRSLYGPHGTALFGFSTWNGASVHKNFVNKYADNDIRKKQWAYGIQYKGTEPIKFEDSNGKLVTLSYDLNISSLEKAGLTEGARSVKHLPAPPFSGNAAASNDYPMFRYAEILLLAAEANLRNGNAGAAKTLLDQVRQRAGLAPFAGTVTLTEIYDERGRELAWEGYRRQDMIRFGTFNADRTAVGDFKAASSSHFKLFPIPAPAIATNANLKQNPGY